MFKDFYKGKRVFITGHTGFKGSWLSLWLKKLGATVKGYALAPNTTPSLFNELNIENIIDYSTIGNITNYNLLSKSISEFKPDIIFHLAAQPLVRESYLNPIETYTTNVIGTLNVLEATKNCSSVKALVNVTTDKCYQNKKQLTGYKEGDQLGGDDIYSSSKACSEILSASYRNSFLRDKKAFALATARAGNVIGGGDWAKDRIIPDCVLAINQNKSIELRNPHATRPWQHVLEPLSGYLLLAKNLYLEGHKYADCFNFGPYEDNILQVQELVKQIIDIYQKGSISIKPQDNLPEAELLALNIDKAKSVLGWIPTYDTTLAIKETIDWYKYYYEQKDNLLDYTLAQIENYEEKINWKLN